MSHTTPRLPVDSKKCGLKNTLAELSLSRNLQYSAEFFCDTPGKDFKFPIDYFPTAQEVMYIVSQAFSRVSRFPKELPFLPTQQD